jgi:hypothetical protein
VDRVGPSGPVGARGVVPGLDHLIFAVPELQAGVAALEERLGVETAPGGHHQGLGTHNRLVGLGPRRYLEVIAVDPDQPDPTGPRWFGLDDLVEPGLVTWCVEATGGLETLIARGREAGIDLGDVAEGSRRRPDGSLLSWTFSDPWAGRAGGVVPFFIDWGSGPHPSDDLPAACSPHALRLEHPEPGRVQGWLTALGLDTPVARGHAPRVVASLETPNGIVELS